MIKQARPAEVSGDKNDFEKQRKFGTGAKKAHQRSSAQPLKGLVNRSGLMTTVGWASQFSNEGGTGPATAAADSAASTSSAKKRCESSVLLVLSRRAMIDCMILTKKAAGAIHVSCHFKDGI
jgi:hypothetical protein